MFVCTTVGALKTVWEKVNEKEESLVCVCACVYRCVLMLQVANLDSSPPKWESAGKLI